MADNFSGKLFFEQAVPGGAIPAVAMVLGSAMAFFFVFKGTLLAAMQSLGAGILLAAIAFELAVELQLDEYHPPECELCSIGIIFGFIFGAAFMFGVKFVCERLEPEEDDGDDEPGEVVPELGQVKPMVDSKVGLLPKSGSHRSAGAGGSIRRKSSSLLARAHRTSSTMIDQSQHTVSGRTPWGLVAAIIIDGAVDGMLVGLGMATDPHTGFILAAASSIEMCFVGTAFTATLRAACSPMKTLVLSAIPPLAIWAGTIMAYLGAGALEDVPELFAALLAFGVAALLFLITQELLADAHEIEGKSIVVGIFLYLGFLLVVVTEQIFPEEICEL